MTPEINNFLASPKGAGVNDDPINDEILKIRNSRKSPTDDLLDFDCDLHGSDLLDCDFIGTLGQCSAGGNRDGTSFLKRVKAGQGSAKPFLNHFYVSRQIVP